MINTTSLLDVPQTLNVSATEFVSLPHTECHNYLSHCQTRKPCSSFRFFSLVTPVCTLSTNPAD